MCCCEQGNERELPFSWVIMQLVMLISYRRFGTTYRSHLQVSAFWIIDPLKMGPLGCPETSVRSQHYSPRNNPEDSSSHPPRGGSLEPRRVNETSGSIKRLRNCQLSKQDPAPCSYKNTEG